MRKILKRGGIVGAVTLIAVGAVALVALGAGGIAAWEYSNSDQFCASTCHSVHPEEIRSHLTSVHARVKCVECHLGRISTLHLIALKPEHAKELWGMIVGYERPIVASTLRPSRDNCESCHWPSVEHHDSITVKKRYDTDPKSSETTYKLVLHTGTGTIRESDAKGIHWHIDNDVQFIATDPQRRVIPWVQVKKADGTVTTYKDATVEWGKVELKRDEARRMECFDCHNAVGHPFPNPADLVDDAIATGRIDRSLPNTKERAVVLIDKATKMTGPYEDLGPKFEKLIVESRPKGDMKPETKALEEKFEASMKQILLDSSFSAPGLSWKTFPNHAGHKDFPGCFRCHDGKHLNEKGEAIRLQCTLCHNLPQVEREDGKGSVPSTVVAGVTPPPSHDEPNFMHDHRTKVDDTCSACHGPIKWGTDGGNFCANPACHGRQWPEMTLDPQAAN